MKNNQRVQFYLDDKMKEKWETFLKNNSLMFSNPSALFRYMLSNIEILTEINPNLISKEQCKNRELEKEIEDLKLENLKLQSELMKQGSKDVISLLEEINYKMDILEVMSSTNLNSFGDINLVPSQESLIYKKAKMEVDLKDKKSIYEHRKESKKLIHEDKKDHKKQNRDEKISSKKQTYNSLFDF